MHFLKRIICSFFLSLLILGCRGNSSSSDYQSYRTRLEDTTKLTFEERLSGAALGIIDPEVQYVPDYIVLDYPGGDVPPKTGVCTDVVIRSYRKLGVDLQKLVHEDMKAHFGLYPKIWKLNKADKNIDHRRVPNLMVFFSRFGKVKSINDDPKEYEPGDIVCWELDNGITHIGIVVNKKSNVADRPMIVHNIGGGQVMDDVLFAYKIIGHYSYSGSGIN